MLVDLFVEICDWCLFFVCLLAATVALNYAIAFGCKAVDRFMNGGRKCDLSSR